MLDLFSRLAERPQAALAGWRESALVRHGDFLGRVRAWAALGRRTEARDVALYLDDSREFGAALVGAWLAGKTVWLVADTLPASCTALEGEVGAFWGQFPSACAPQLPLPGDDWAGAWATPAPDYPALVVYTSGSTGAPAPIRKQYVQLITEVEVLEAQFGARIAGAAVVSTVSHQHIYGLLFRVLWPLACGRPVEALRHEFPETLVPALRLRDSLLLASPAHQAPAGAPGLGRRARAAACRVFVGRHARS
ncbi:hypothetical protein [Massilia sp. Dwa41.01b]|uniref:hypothetical protein n=1 Tax=Massilia sp. Dwa41.01b TaxID=2709302 RepID=UPI001E560BBB|nr:hypothetical protein [Massilia sp. Dwa41.01b]